MGKLDALKKAFTGNARESIGADRPAVKLATPAEADPRSEGVSRSAAVVREVRLDRIEPDPDQPRRTCDAASLAELAASLGARGQQSAILVYWHAPSQLHRIVFGERRWRAAKLAGWEAIRAEVLEAPPDPATIRLHQIVENDQREDLGALERARSYADAIALNGWNQAQFCEATGILKARVSKALALLKLAGPVQGLLDAGRLDASIAYELRHLDAVGQCDVAAVADAHGWSGAQVRAEVDRRLGRDVVPLPDQAPLPIAGGPALPGVATVSGGNSPADPPTPAQDLRREIRKAAEGIVSTGSPPGPHPIDAHLARVKEKAASGTLAPADDDGPIAEWTGPQTWGAATHFDFEPEIQAGDRVTTNGMTITLGAGAGYADVVSFLVAALNAAKYRAALAAVKPSGARPGDRVECLDESSPHLGLKGTVEPRVDSVVSVRWEGAPGDLGHAIGCHRGERLRLAPAGAGKGGGS